MIVVLFVWLQTLVGVSYWIAQDCSRLGLFHRQKNHCLSVRQDSLTMLSSITKIELWFLTITVLMLDTHCCTDIMITRNTIKCILGSLMHSNKRCTITICCFLQQWSYWLCLPSACTHLCFSAETGQLCHLYCNLGATVFSCHCGPWILMKSCAKNTVSCSNPCVTCLLPSLILPLQIKAALQHHDLGCNQHIITTVPALSPCVAQCSLCSLFHLISASHTHCWDSSCQGHRGHFRGLTVTT